MQKLAARIAVLALLSIGSLFAQSLLGTWQGTLRLPAQESRIVIKVSAGDTPSLNGVLYYVDHAGQGLPSGSIAMQASSVKMSFPGIGGLYEGRLSADAQSLAGTWTQESKTTPLTLTRATEQTAWVIPEPAAPPKPMATDADPAFEVATIKPSKPEEHFSILRKGRQIATTSTSLSSLIMFAYGVHARQIVNGPEWLETDKYDVVAEPDRNGQPSTQQVKTMFQKLMADRFQLNLHRDRKELPVYAIAAGRTPHGLTPSGDSSELYFIGFRGGIGKVVARNANMADLAGFMQLSVLDRPVVDQTRILGRFDFTLNWTPDQFQTSTAPADPAVEAFPDVYTAIQQQLGLKIESTKALIDVLVIDRVEKPSGN